MQLHFKTFGSGPPLIILHGMLGMLDNWQSFARRLADTYTVFIVDLRNHGKSPHADTMTYPEMAEDLHDFMDAHWLFEGAYLMGHSMGGKVAMEFAIQNPELVWKLAVIDIAPIAYKPSHVAILDAMISMPIDTLEDRRQAEDHLMKHIGNRNIVAFLLKNLVRVKDQGFSWRVNIDAINHQYQYLLQAPTSPTGALALPSLFVKGEQSTYVQTSMEGQIAERFANFQLVEIANAGHWVHVDQPNALESVVRYFFLEES